MDLQESLAQFGLTRQEAELFLTLIAEGELSGYEAAKHSGLSRSNAYAGLASLVAQGAAYVIDGTVPRYAALPPQEFFHHRIRQLQELSSRLLPSFPQRRTTPEGYQTINGNQAVLDRMKTMVEGAQLRLYLSLEAKLLLPLVPSLTEAAQRGIKITALTDADLALPGAVIHATVPPPGQIRLIVDSAEVITGDWDDVGGTSCLYSRRPALVDLFKQALGNEIRLLELGEIRRTE